VLDTLRGVTRLPQPVIDAMQATAETAPRLPGLQRLVIDRLGSLDRRVRDMLALVPAIAADVERGPRDGRAPARARRCHRERARHPAGRRGRSRGNPRDGRTPTRTGRRHRAGRRATRPWRIRAAANARGAQGRRRRRHRTPPRPRRPRTLARVRYRHGTRLMEPTREVALLGATRSEGTALTERKWTTPKAARRQRGLL
jgi:hypothetical protein